MQKFFSKLTSVVMCVLLSTGLYAQQLNEGFEGEQFPPEGWTTIDGYSGYGWKKGVKLGHNCAKIQEVTGTENWLITPQLRPAAGEKLSFSACVGDYASSGELRIEVSLGSAEKESFELLDTYYTSQSKGDAAHRLWKTDWREYTIDLSAYNGAPIYIAFHQTGSTDIIFLDDVKGVSVQGNSSCDVPTSVVLSSITSNSATISWEGEAAEYQYVLLTQGESADWSDATQIAAKSVTLTELEENTSYIFYVRSYCSEEEQSLAPKLAFHTPCESESIPWVETFSHDATGAVEPDCWTVSSAVPQVWVVADKTYDDEGEAQTVYGQAHLYASGGGPSTEQVFALPTFAAQLNTLEIAFDYKTSMATADYGVLEIGYMTNPSKASTFVSLESLPQTLTYVRKTVALSDLPVDAQFIAFRFAGGTSDLSGVSMDNFVVAEIGKSGEIDPGEQETVDDHIWGLSYCEAQFHWYSYNNEAFAIGLFDAEAQALIAGIAVTTSECDRFAYEDKAAGVFSGFSENDDYNNHYYCSTKWILNVDEDGLQKGDSWSKCVTNIGTALSPVLGLKEGSYQVQVYGLDPITYERGASLATIPFTLTDKKVTNLAVAVAEDKQSATLTWEAPAFSTGERCYVSVRAGESVAYDNFETSDKPVSPLTFAVEEGKSYEARVQIIDKNKNPLGSEVVVNFTVGVNPYEPTNVHAEVAGGDNVTFSWESVTAADRYVITLFWEGEYYTSLTVAGQSKMTTMPKDGTWSWTVQAFNQGENGNYFEVSLAIEGNSFVSKAADIPEDAIILEVWRISASYMDVPSIYDPGDKHAWQISLATGEENGTGRPSPIFMIYSDKEYAISGVYNVTRGNLDLNECGMDITGKPEGAVDAEDAELRLQFVGYDDDKAAQGPYRYGYFTGQFRIVGKDGKTYFGKFMEQFCNSFNFSSYTSAYLDHKPLWDEDPDYVAPTEGIEDIESQKTTTKILREGQLLILRDGRIYTITGMEVR